MRKPISLAVAKDHNGCDVLYALFDDSTIWALHEVMDNETFENKFEWLRLDIPELPGGFIEQHTDTSWSNGI